MISQYPMNELSTELLLKIFGYLNIPDLCSLKQTCKRFNEIISRWDHAILKNLSTIVTNQRSQTFLFRCPHRLSALEKIRISKNWIRGRYREKSLLFVKKKYIPWLYLCDKSILMSRGKKIYNFARKNDYINIKPKFILQGMSKADVVNFQLKNDLLVSGQRDGGIWLTSLYDKKVIFDKENCHDSDINSVDISNCGNIIVSGCRNNNFKIWNVNYDDSELVETYSKRLQDRVWRVSLLNEKPLLAVGTAGNFSLNPLLVYDVERISDDLPALTEFPSISYGMGICDIKWDTPNTLWTCGYDSCLKKYDLRTGKCEQKFFDPFASTLYCLECDYFNTIMTGTQLYGRVILWDVRKNNCVQMYYMECCKKGSMHSSPIYSLSFDSKYLFTATDQNLNVLDFTGHNEIVKDYSSFCVHKSK